MDELKSSVRLVAGIFLSISLISSVLACAVWEFPSHELSKNVVYLVGVGGGLLLNIVIFICLFRGMANQNPSYFLPYIVCSFLNLTICLTLSVVFCLSSIRSFYSGIAPMDAVAFFVVLLCSIFWYWSLKIVKIYREYLTKISGKHTLFNNPEFV
ncbi:unnamed protein product [Auanema sp. JU1783]|nr:unnamed protein product [Auanema sp. JU1783]